MSEMVDRVANAIVAKQCDGAWLLDDLTDDAADKARAIARAVLVELRKPTAAMLQLACSSHVVGEPMRGTESECPHIVARRRSWAAMIDEALR